MVNSRRLIQKQVLLDLQFLSSLELSERLIIPLIFRVLRACVRASFFCFFRFDSSGNPVEFFCSEADIALLLRDLIIFSYNKKESPWIDRFSLSIGDFYKVEIDRILRKSNVDYVTRVVMSDGRGGHGAVFLGRTREEGSFTLEDDAFLRKFERYFLDVLKLRDASFSGSEVQEGAEGIIILDAQGSVLYTCASGKKLLDLAGSLDYLKGPEFLGGASVIEQGLKRLCECMMRIKNHAAEDRVHLGENTKSGQSVQKFIHTNQFGNFIFRGSWLSAELVGVENAICVRIEQRVSWTLRIAEKLLSTDLSLKERQVTLKYLEGCSHQEVADRLGMMRNTVISHIRSVYYKCKVSDRESLFRKIVGVSSHCRMPDRLYLSSRGLEIRCMGNVYDLNALQHTRDAWVSCQRNDEG